MKAITIKQPYASLIVEGIKDIENRTWKCPEKYIGQRVLIHSSSSEKYDKLPLDKMFTESQLSRLYEKYTETELCKRVYPFGAIIGSVEIVDCVVNHPSIWAEKTEEPLEYYTGEEEFGYCTIYNWVLANPIKFPKPIPAKGKLGFWESECEILICNQCGQYCLHNNKDVGVPNWGNPVHICEHCGNMMLESEFDYLK
jgi:predicted transcriptional regulator